MLGSAMDRDARRARLLEREVEAETREHGDVLPPWLRHPEHPRFAGFWYAGGGDWFIEVWMHRASSMTIEERVAYFRKHAPVPTAWADWVASAVYGEWELASDDALVAQVKRLERETGLVDASAWEATLAPPR